MQSSYRSRVLEIIEPLITPIPEVGAVMQLLPIETATTLQALQISRAHGAGIADAMHVATAVGYFGAPSAFITCDFRLATLQIPGIHWFLPDPVR